MIYLDNAASTPLLPQVKEKLIEVLDVYGNPSSLHIQGQMAKEIIDETKSTIAKNINCDEDEIFFTSGATMSNNLILQGFRGDVIVSAIEHEDILMMADNFRWNKIGVDNFGEIKISELYINLLKEDTKLVSIQMANSEIGILQNIQEISKMCHCYNSFLHTDATQYIPYYPIDVKKMGIDSLSMSGQKIGCIKGIGFLYISKKLQTYIKPIIYGKQGLIGGTENVLGIACLSKAFKELSYNNDRMVYLRDKLIDGLDGKLIGDKYNRLPNNVCVCFQGLPAETIVMLLDEKGICCSAGSACSNNDNEPSSTLLSLGLSEDDAKSCVRFTLGKETTESEINETIKITNSIVKMLRELI